MTSEHAPSPDPDPESPDAIVRFVPDKKKFKSHRLFFPPKDGRLSVCHAASRSNEELFEIGIRFVSAGCVGFARTPAGIYTELELRVDRDDHPYPGHANVQIEMPISEEFRNKTYRLVSESDWVSLHTSPADPSLVTES